MKVPQHLIHCSKRFILPKTVKAVRATDHPVNDIELQGWVEKVHKSGKIAFLHLKDGLSADSIQVVVPKEMCNNVAMGSGVSVTGDWAVSSGGRQKMELQATALQLLSKDSNPRYSSMSPDVLRKQMHVRSRSDVFSAILRLRSRIFIKTHQYFQENQFVHVDTPLLTANDCEGAGETFVAKSTDDMDFFGSSKTVYLSVSSQLHLEAITSGISRVYTLSSGIRADKQQSSCHLTEFKMLEAEIAFCNSLDSLCDLTEDYFRSLVKFCLNDITVSEEVQHYSAFSNEEHLNDLQRILDVPKYPRLTYEDAVVILSSIGSMVTGNGLTKQNELALVDHFKSPLFITRFPVNQKPFYMKRTEGNEETLSFDFLCPTVGELAGGSIREDDIEKLEKRNNKIDWYIDCRKRGKPVSAGFGLGFERLIQVLLGVRNIKDTVAFPRWYKHCQG